MSLTRFSHKKQINEKMNSIRDFRFKQKEHKKITLYNVI
jgi:hypothetical protein